MNQMIKTNKNKQCSHPNNSITICLYESICRYLQFQFKVYHNKNFVSLNFGSDKLFDRSDLAGKQNTNTRTKMLNKTITTRHLIQSNYI